MNWSVERIPVHWRAFLIGAALYLLYPFAHAPAWLWQSVRQSEAESAAALAPVLSFHSKYGDAALPALNAQLELNKLRDYELALQAANAKFADQDRDERWAQATEFMIAHVTQNVSGNTLRIYHSECRNNLCRLEIAAPAGLTAEFRAQVLKLAATLKTGDLEFHDLQEGKDRLLLELKSDKPLKYGYFTRLRLAPAARETWREQVRIWLKEQK